MAIARRVNRVGIVRRAKIAVATGRRVIARPSRRAAASVNRIRTKATTGAARNRAAVVAGMIVPAMIVAAMTVAVANSVAEAATAVPTCAVPKAPSKSNTTS